MAKRLVRESPSPEAETCLAQIYQERIRELQEAGLTQDAKNLIEVAKLKCPTHKKEFESLLTETFCFPLSQTEVSTIVSLLQQSPCDETTRIRLLETLKTGLSDPRHLL